MPDSIVKEVIQEIDPLAVDDTVATAARRVLETGLPALPAVEGDGSFAGIFGEREFMGALFPGYVGELASARMVSKSMDRAIDRRLECGIEGACGDHPPRLLPDARRAVHRQGGRAR